MKRLSQCKILITGVNGQVGYELVKSLSCTGAELILAARRKETIRLNGYQTVSMDLSNPAEVSECLSAIGPDLIINPAAYTAVDKAESDAATAYLVNRDAVATMAKAMRMSGGALIHFSTDYVYDPEHSRSLLETDPVSPCNVYAQSKYEGEKALAESGVPFLILRTSWVYGVNGNNFVKTMLRLGRERELLKIVGDQHGCPTSAATLAQAVATILIQGEKDPIDYLKQHSGIFNISDSGTTSWFEFAKEIFRQANVLGRELKVKDLESITSAEYPTPAKRPLNSRLDLLKIKQHFGIEPPKWQQSLSCFLQN